MKRAFCLAAALALAGCSLGGSDDSGGKGPAGTLRAFMTAVSEDDVDVMWEHMSSAARSRHNGNRHAFRRVALPDLHERIPRGTRVPDPDKFLLFQVGEWTVAAAALETVETAFAAALHQEDGRWKVDPGGRILRLVAGPPHPGSAVDAAPRVDFSVYSRARDLRVLFWLDEQEQELRGAGGPAFTRYWAEPPRGSAPGRTSRWRSHRAAAASRRLPGRSARVSPANGRSRAAVSETRSRSRTGWRGSRVPRRPARALSVGCAAP